MTNFREPRPVAEADLFWLAFRYVDDAMGPEEAAQFETRLEHEQSAREAVAEAVELTAAVGAAARPAAARRTPLASASSPLTPASRHWSSSRGWSAPAAWLSLGAAACLGFALTSYWLHPQPDSVPVVRIENPAPSGDARLADAWASTDWHSDEIVEESANGAVEHVEGETFISDDLIDDMFAFEAEESVADADWESDDGELIISDWLLEAISAERAASSKSGHREG